MTPDPPAVSPPSVARVGLGGPGGPRAALTERPSAACPGAACPRGVFCGGRAAAEAVGGPPEAEGGAAEASGACDASQSGKRGRGRWQGDGRLFLPPPSPTLRIVQRRKESEKKTRRLPSPSSSSPRTDSKLGTCCLSPSPSGKSPSSSKGVASSGIEGQGHECRGTALQSGGWGRAPLPFCLWGKTLSCPGGLRPAFGSCEATQSYRFRLSFSHNPGSNLFCKS